MKVVLKEGHTEDKSIYNSLGRVNIINAKGKEVGYFSVPYSSIGLFNERVFVVSDGILSQSLGGTIKEKQVVKIENYFQDWTHPTEQEAEMFKMMFGVDIPWERIELG